MTSRLTPESAVEFFNRPRPSREDRRRVGAQRQNEAPLEGLAEVPTADRRRDALTLVREQEAGRDVTRLPLRYERMSANPFAYLRGAAAVMASDLDLMPNSGITVQLCGDAHLANFGMFASPERTLLFDLNDFDETLPGPWEWDVKRLAASLEIAARSNGYPRKVRRRIVVAECVDHIDPIDGAADPRFMDETNHQALCDTCHAVKRQREAARSSRPRAARRSYRPAGGPSRPARCASARS